MSTLAGDKKIGFDHLDPSDKRGNFELAFSVAESCGVFRMLDADDMSRMTQPDKYSVMLYLSEVYKILK